MGRQWCPIADDDDDRSKELTQIVAVNSPKMKKSPWNEIVWQFIPTVVVHLLVVDFYYLLVAIQSATTNNYLKVFTSAGGRRRECPSNQHRSMKIPSDVVANTTLLVLNDPSWNVLVGKYSESLSSSHMSLPPLKIAITLLRGIRNMSVQKLLLSLGHG